MPTYEPAAYTGLAGAQTRKRPCSCACGAQARRPGFVSGSDDAVRVHDERQVQAVAVAQRRIGVEDLRDLGRDPAPLRLGQRGERRVGEQVIAERLTRQLEDVLEELVLHISEQPRGRDLARPVAAPPAGPLRARLGERLAHARDRRVAPVAMVPPEAEAAV